MTAGKGRGGLRSRKTYTPPPRCPGTLDLEDWLADHPEPSPRSVEPEGEGAPDES